MVFVLLYYKNFDNLEVSPDIWIIPASKIEEIKKPWQNDGYALFLYKEYAHLLDPYKNAWTYLD